MQTVSAGFTTAAGAAGAQVCDYVEVAWAGGAVATLLAAARGGTGWTNETARLVSHSGQLRLNAPGEELVAPGDIGQATVILSNDDGRYSWRNAASALAANIGTAIGLSGKLIRIWAGFYVSGSPEYVCLFTGVIADWREDPGAATVELDSRDIGYLYLQDKRSSLMYTDQRPDVWLGVVADLVGIGAAPAGRSLDTATFPIPWCWLDDESAVEEMWDTARADGGLVYFDQTGKLRFENVVHWAGHTTVWTFQEHDYQQLRPENSIDDVATTIVSEWSGRARGAPVVAYNLDALKVVRPGETIAWTARFSHPLTILYDPTAAAPFRDYAAVSEGGADLTASLTVTLTPAKKYAQQCEVSVANAHTTLAARIAFLQIRGQPLIGGPTEQVEVDANPAPYSFKRKRGVRGNVYVQTKQQADSLTGYLAARHGRVRPVYRLSGAPAVPQLELGDKIAWAESLSFGTTGGAANTLTGHVVGIAWRGDAEQGLTQEIDAQDDTGLYAYPDYFIIADSTLGKLGAHGRAWY